MTGTAPQLQAIKQACRALVQAAGGIEQAAVFAGRSKSQMGRYVSVHEPDVMPIDVVVALEAVTQGLAGAPHVTQLLARLVGFEVVRTPDDPSSGGVWLDTLGGLAEDSGALQGCIAKAVADGVVDGQERAEIMKRAATLAAQVAHIVNMARE